MTQLETAITDAANQIHTIEGAERFDIVDEAGFIHAERLPIAEAMNRAQSLADEFELDVMVIPFAAKLEEVMPLTFRPAGS